MYGEKIRLLTNISYLFLPDILSNISRENNLDFEIIATQHDTIEKELTCESPYKSLISVHFMDLGEDAISIFSDRMKNIINWSNSKNTYAITSVPILDHFRSSSTAEIMSINKKIYEKCIKEDIEFIDVNLCDNIANVAPSYNYKYYFKNLILFKEETEKFIANKLFSKIKNIEMKKIKCVVLDCDNTLWGGILGEDGPKGIKYNVEDPIGQIFYDFQLRLKELKKKGLLLALATKNNFEDVEALFQCNSLPLKWDDFVQCEASWDLKSIAIQSIAQNLNIGLESILFIDDSPYEINLIKETLPDVKCITVPSEYYNIPKQIFPLINELMLKKKASNFDRNAAYAARQNAIDYEKSFSNYTEFLENLGLQLEVNIDDLENVPRFAEMLVRTNQFNTNKLLLDEHDLTEYCQGAHSIVFSGAVIDKFGKHGITNLMICKLCSEQASVTVETFLMSCRVFGRQIEYAFLKMCLDWLSNNFDLKTIQFNYTKTAKNVPAKSFLDEITAYSENPVDLDIVQCREKLNNVSTDFIKENISEL